MKRFIGLVMIMSVLLQSVGGYSASGDEIISEEEMIVSGSAISEELREAMEAGTETDTYRVMVWTDDIDYDAVEQMAETATGTSWAEIESVEDDIYAEAVTEAVNQQVKSRSLSLIPEESLTADREEVFAIVDERMDVVQDEVNALVMAERTAAKSLYAVNNQKLAENTVIANDVEFVSRYSPMVIAELTKNQIEELAEDEIVTGIYLVPEEEAVCEEYEEVNQETYATTAVNSYNGYLEYISASVAHGMGYTGEGVKVGLLDFKKVYSTDHSELGSSNITPLGVDKVVDKNWHGILMARVICGSNGVAPDCELYSIYLNNVYSDVETLLDNGVSVINMSFQGQRETSYYTAYEMWIDHIAASHTVVAVCAAGNYGQYASYNVTQPGLAYNTITVANVDCVNDIIYTTSCYINNSTGAQKPDVASAGANVLGELGGTSAATATVTGMIAIMLEAKPSLIGKPHIIKAIVIASADHIAGSDTWSSSYNNKQGAGVVNVRRALSIISRGQYWGNYISSNGTTTYTKSVVPGESKTSFVFVGTKMNVGTVNHGSSEYSNQDMPDLLMVITTTGGSGLGGCNMPNSSVEVVRTTYNSSVNILLTVSNIGTRGLPYAVAWY